MTMRLDTTITAIVAAVCLLPFASLVMAPAKAAPPVLIQQADCPDGNCPVPADSGPSPEKCGAAGGGIVAALLLLARIAYASGRADFLGPFFDWLSARRAKNPPA